MTGTDATRGVVGDGNEVTWCEDEDVRRGPGPIEEDESRDRGPLCPEDPGGCRDSRERRWTVPITNTVYGSQDLSSRSVWLPHGGCV